MSTHEGSGARRPVVVVVAEAAPMRGGIATFAETISADPRLHAEFDMRLLNTARTAVRAGGKLVWSNVTHALDDARRTWRASRTADVVHLQLVADPGLPMVRAAALVLAARWGGAAVVAHSHSATGNAGRSTIAAYGPLDRLLLRTLRLARLVMTVSDAGTATLRPMLGSTPVRTCDNAIDVSALPVPDRQGRADDVPTVLFVGVVCERKGVHDLAAATARLRARGVTSWRLVVAGGQGPTPEPEYQSLVAAMAEAGVPDAMVGEQDHDGVLRLLREADVFVLPSYLEGQPMAIIEAMAAALPVVGGRTGAVPQLVTDDVNGYVVEPGDVGALETALERLVTDAGRRARFGAASRERAERTHDLPALSARLAEAYRQVLAPAGAGRPSGAADRTAPGKVQ